MKILTDFCKTVETGMDPRLVYESRDPSCQLKLMKCHAVTTLPFTSLATTVSKSGNSKACLIDRSK